MNKRISILNCPIDVLTMQETLQLIHNAIKEKRPIHHVVVNAAKLVNVNKDEALRDSVVNCDIINADGQAVVWASRLLRRPLPERVAGIDLMSSLVASAAGKGHRIFFLGAKEEIVSKVVEKYKAAYGADIIAGYRNGYFKKEEEQTIAEQIAASNADILFVAMSSPKKEIFLDTYKTLIKTPFIMGVGGSFDVISGLVKRAPVWMQKAGLEWFYRFLQEPRRMWKRAFVVSGEFVILVLREKFRQLLSKNSK